MVIVPLNESHDREERFLDLVAREHGMVLHRPDSEESVRRRRPPVAQHRKSRYYRALGLRPRSPPARRISRPLRRHYWQNREIPQCDSQKWTVRKLARARQEFWETRQGGKPPAWATLRVVSEALRQGQYLYAQCVFNAAGFSTPDGNLVNGCYDESGELYRLEPWVFSDPPSQAMRVDDSDLESDQSDVRSDSEATRVTEGYSDTESSEATLTEWRQPKRVREYFARRYGGRGLASIDESASASRTDRRPKCPPLTGVKVRINMDDRDVCVPMIDGGTASDLRRGVRTYFNLPAAAQVRMVLRGKVLDQRKQLTEQGWTANQVVRVYVQDRPF
ncbi:hypothetical protein KEM52_005391 [Ascosphaera acerosa]|nr:hypothetical protein KEM52_005391 [Ascosphaera acerosa]